jgi:hypothetical protein
VQRYVRLGSGLLSYAADEMDFRPKGTVELDSIKASVVCPAGSTGKHNAVFQLTLLSGKEIQLSLSNAGDCAKWSAVLTESVAMLSSRQASMRLRGIDGTTAYDSDSDASA